MAMIPEDARHFDRRGMVYALIWLLYLIYPISDLLGSPHPSWQYPVGILGITLFVVVYVRVWRGRAKQVEILLSGIVITVVAVSLCLLLDNAYLGVFIYAAAAYARLKSTRQFALLGAANIIVMLVVSFITRMYFGTFIGLGFAVIATTVGVRGVTALISYAQALREAREEVARLARSEERERIARDLHDLLGHTLSLVVLKSDLAGRLLERDPSAAANEIRELQGVARAALGEVREAVTGYLPRSLQGELTHAGRMLRAAGIRASLPETAPEMPPEQDAALALVVREAVTNVIRHSGAGSCSISICPGSDGLSLTIEDDGRMPEGSVPGNGIEGMRLRVEHLRGELRWAGVPGMRLSVTLPALRTD